jgi:type I restriction enzyme M protein
MTALLGSYNQGVARAGRTSDHLGRYYTSSLISRSLIDSIELQQPDLILELGSGSGALCTAAATRWHEAKLITVDVDQQAPDQLNIAKFAQQVRHLHFIHDVLDDALSDRIGLRLDSVDVAVCNPPYIRPHWRADFGKILEGAGLSGTLTSLHDAGADLLFLAQNLRLLRRNGKLGLIMPDGLVTGEKFYRVRRALLRQHLVEQVVQLPRRVFKGTEAQAYLVVLSKMGGETDWVKLRRMGTDGDLSASIQVPQDAAEKRLDYAFHARIEPSRSARDGHVKIAVRDALTDLLRGTVCSSGIANFRMPVFHLGDFANPPHGHGVRVVPKRFALSDRNAQRAAAQSHLALPGDILLARVGRGLQDRLALVVHGPCAISDCIFALRPTDKHRERLYRFFESDLGRSVLASSAHGVAAQFLSKANLLDIQF